MPQPTKKLTIIGSGLAGALEAYAAYLSAKKVDQQVRVTILEKNPTLTESTSANIVPSLTPDEILSVVPRGQLLMEKLKILFKEPGGIRVDDVPGVNNSTTADEFIQQVLAYSQDEEGHEKRTQSLLDLGKRSMDLWQEMYDHADDELKAIFRDANFNPCRELDDDQMQLHKGYRIDLIYAVSDARARAEDMQKAYQNIGYLKCKLMTPDEVEATDGFLQDFCASHAVVTGNGQKQWRDDAVALWRPGGCLDTSVFLPKFYDYLAKIMGEYQHTDGSMRKNFQIKFNRKVEEVIFSNADNHKRVSSLKFFGSPDITIDTNVYQAKDYVFCPGQSVGTLRKLGFDEPAYAGFAGAVLKLEIPLTTPELIAQYQDFNHCMEVHQEGVVLAWQARFHENKIVIGVGGTKAFYGDQEPNRQHEFAQDRNLLQLNMINTVLPQMISLALQKDTHNQTLSPADFSKLEELGIAKGWVGNRAVTFDGYPTFGELTVKNEPVKNARATTHLGSGGISFGVGGVAASRAAREDKPDQLMSEVLAYSHANRRR